MNEINNCDKHVAFIKFNNEEDKLHVHMWLIDNGYYVIGQYEKTFNSIETMCMSYGWAFHFTNFDDESEFLMEGVNCGYDIDMFKQITKLNKNK